ncbi:MAG: hypothetical protein WCE63_14170 [Acidobacteriaceae bacterium]
MNPSQRSIDAVPRGICKLCHKDATLQRSHLIGRAIYRLCREDNGEDPIVMTTDVVMKTSRQIRDYVLCASCEDLFSKGGERYVTNLVWRRRNGFPLLDKLRLAVPMKREPDYQVFSAEQVGINADKLAYYALSVVWRSGIHSWKTIGNQMISEPLSAADEESIRKYLLGETALPENIGVMVNVCIDGPSQVLVLPPTMLGNTGSYRIYRLLIRGIDFNVLVATAPNTQFVEICCVRSATKSIFLCDRTEIRLNEVRHFFETTKLAQNVRIKL